MFERGALLSGAGVAPASLSKRLGLGLTSGVAGATPEAEAVEPTEDVAMPELLKALPELLALESVAFLPPPFSAKASTAMNTGSFIARSSEFPKPSITSCTAALNLPLAFGAFALAGAALVGFSFSSRSPSFGFLINCSWRGGSSPAP